MKKKIFAIFAIVGMLVLVSGCVEEKTDITSADTGNVKFTVGDVPIETFDNVYITFSEIKIHEKMEDDNGSWIVITQDETTVDLIQLHIDNETAIIGEAEIEVGNYSKIWIHVINATAVLNETSETVDLKVPSGWLKIQQLHLLNVEEGNNTVEFDINLELSIHPAGKSGKYIFAPIISRIRHKHEEKLKLDKDPGDISENQAPVIDILVDGEELDKNMKVDVDADTNVTFNASASFDPEGHDLSFFWNFGDGTNATTAEAIHMFADSNQPYTVTLTVTNVDDETDSSSETLKVHINK